ncbi:MAG: hypothetical protein CMC79_02580 [Flavobacteriaceae bacterium]|nr:hypothetical protein [Flavobacteriaceae bacterium]|tara:strand:- start:31418 stop:32296 length:879 start_codon:yes stop_codon:yes gene_type:complete
MKSNLKIILFIIIILFITLILAYGVGYGDDNYSFIDSLAFKAWAIIFLIQLIVFVPSFLFKTEFFFDLTGGITFLSTSIFLGLELIKGEQNLINYRLIPLFLVVFWAVRLSAFLFLRIKKSGLDVRFNEIKKNFFRFLLTWTLQGFWVFMCMLPLLVIAASKEPLNKVFLFAGISLWILGWLIEIISDTQKTIFNSDPNRKGKFISTGLWSISRHPNYFGELVLWIGITVIAFPTLNGLKYLALITPVFVYLLLKNVSGVNLLEKSAEKKWGKEEEYQIYKNNTPVFFPKIF